jgi:hypothetical protein
VAVIALAGFVVVAKPANAIDHIGHSVFEPVCRSAERAWQLPDDDLDKGAIAKDAPFAVKQIGLHGLVVVNNADSRCCQS